MRIVRSFANGGAPTSDKPTNVVSAETSSFSLSIGVQPGHYAS
jgi:hypothetical protein